MVDLLTLSFGCPVTVNVLCFSYGSVGWSTLCLCGVS